MSSLKDTLSKQRRRLRRRRSIRRKIFGSSQKPRLTIFRSHRHIYCQLIDDFSGRTLAAASTREKDVAAALSGFSGNRSAALLVGKAIAAKAKELGIERVQLDRNGYRYHGSLKALAEAARESGLKF
jgi:large subunit ribosomal protein L18